MADSSPSPLNGKEAMWYTTGKSEVEIPAFGKTAHEAHTNATPHLDVDDTFNQTETILVRKMKDKETREHVLLDCLRMALNEKHTLNLTLGDAQQANTELRARATAAESQCVALKTQLDALLDALAHERSKHANATASDDQTASIGEASDEGSHHPEKGPNGQVDRAPVSGP